jgi:hypothetical protein
MGQVAKYFNATLDDRVAFTAFDVGDKTDTTVVVFVGWIVKALCGRHPYVVCHGWSSAIGERKHGLLFLLRIFPPVRETGVSRIRKYDVDSTFCQYT